MAQEVLLELDHGISTAYRQLREVLSAFRLQLSGAGFPGAVNTAVDAFRNRTGLEITVKNALIGVELVFKRSNSFHPDSSRSFSQR